MFAGAKINETEGRAVLHTALRNLDTPVVVDGRRCDACGPRHPCAPAQLLPSDVRTGRFAGQGGQITDVVNIGIGGSDLGPAMATLALAPYHDGPRCHFVSNVDGAHIPMCCAGLNPETTLVIVASKTFTTIETMTNAETARDWMAGKVADPAAQFAAVSTAADKTAAFGIDAARVFGFDDWVGGRYSMWGPIGLALMLAVGPEDFDDFLAGGADYGRAFPRRRRWRKTCRCCWRLVGIWHNQICGYATRAVLPYDQRLSRLPAYLQQLEMESNGKRVAMDGSDLAHALRPGGLGRTGHQWPACVLSADPSGHPRGAVRIPAWPDSGHEPRSCASASAAGRQLPCPVRGADARPLAWPRRQRSWPKKACPGPSLTVRPATGSFLAIALRPRWSTRN